jgi:hypothetical protein
MKGSRRFYNSCFAPSRRPALTLVACLVYSSTLKTRRNIALDTPRCFVTRDAT